MGACQAIARVASANGATLEALIVATGWLPHTARAALTGLRHSGYDVRLERGQNGSASVYRIDASQATGP